MLELAVDTWELADEWERHLHRTRLHARALVTDALAELRDHRDVSDLGHRICPAAAQAFGVTWTLLARVDGDTWTPWKWYDAARSERGWADLTGATPASLATLPIEAEVVRTGHALSTTSSTGRAESGVVRVAPVSVAGQVTALLHLPVPVDSDEDSDFDERVAIFTGGLGRILERALLHDRFRSQRVRMQAALSMMERNMTSLDAGIDLVRLVGREHADTVSAVRVPIAGTPPAWYDVLTTRERDVMELVVLGHDNAAIAQQLAITTNTVKSHLRSIMRKLGAVSRTELISLHQATPEVWWPRRRREGAGARPSRPLSQVDQ